MLKLYKFRSLADCRSFDRARQIVETGEFWCSQFWDLNDPMEGVYLGSADHRVRETLEFKANRAICSFSGQRAFPLPLMWGYYASGFKGLAIEITAEAGADIHPVQYVPTLPSRECQIGNERIATFVDRVLTTKLTPWEHEDEYRFICQSDQPCSRKIGNITGVYFGRPYRDIENAVDVRRLSNRLDDYECFVERLKRVADTREVSYFDVKLEGTKVIPVQSGTLK